ncbi:MAG: hypothetical protein ACFFBD_21290, partial [Candidatus Hodarchaeota archaeon]
QLKKKDIFKWMFYTRQRRGEIISDTLRVVQHLTFETITEMPFPTEDKRKFCKEIIQAIKMLQVQGFICKDPEIAAWALKRILLKEKGPQKYIPKELIAATTRMTYRMRKMLKNISPED